MPFQVPFRVAFRSYTLGHPYLAINVGLDLIFLFDVVTHFLRAYVNKKSVLVYDLRRIAKRYMGSSFTFDFFTACPFDLLLATAGAGHTYRAWLRLPKLLRLSRLQEWCVFRV